MTDQRTDKKSSKIVPIVSLIMFFVFCFLNLDAAGFFLFVSNRPALYAAGIRFGRGYQGEDINEMD